MPTMTTTKLAELKELVNTIQDIDFNNKANLNRLLDCGYNLSNSYIKFYEQVKRNRNVFNIATIGNVELSDLQTLVVKTLRETFNDENLGYDAYVSKHNTFKSLIVELKEMIINFREKQNEASQLFFNLYTQDVVKGIISFYMREGENLSFENRLVLSGLKDDLTLNDVEKLNYLIRNFSLKVSKRNGNERIPSELKEFRKAFVSCATTYYLCGSDKKEELDRVYVQYFVNDENWKWNAYLKKCVEDGEIELELIRF